MRRVAPEKAFSTLIEKELQRQAGTLAAAGEEPAQIRAAIEALGDDAKMREVLEYVLAQGTDLGVSIAVDQLAGAGIRFDYRLVNEEAARWAKSYSYELVRGIDATTQTVLRTEFDAWTRTGEPYSALVRRLAPTFGRQRAKLIATTETTRAYAEGSMAIYRASGVVAGVEWLTAGDRAVCKICSPLDGKVFPLAGLTKPPLHPGCRCALAPVVGSPEEVDAAARGLPAPPAETATPKAAPTMPGQVGEPPAAPAREAPKRMVPDAPDLGPVTVDAPGPIPGYAIPAQPGPGLPYMVSAEGKAEAEVAADRSVKMYVTRRGGDPAEVAATVDTTFRKLVAENNVAIQFKSQHIDSLLTDGRFKTQFETASSGGTLNTRIRAEAEERGLGIPQDVDPKQRPIYGFIDLGKQSRFNVAQYGDLTFVAKPELHQRATVTADDSLGNMQNGLVAGTPATNPGKAGWDRQVASLYEYAKSGDLTDLTYSFSYIEVQMQQGVTLADMRAVIDARGVLTGAQRQALKERGVEVWDK